MQDGFWFIPVLRAGSLSGLGAGIDFQLIEAAGGAIRAATLRGTKSDGAYPSLHGTPEIE